MRRTALIFITTLILISFLIANVIIKERYIMNNTEVEEIFMDHTISDFISPPPPNFPGNPPHVSLDYEYYYINENGTSGILKDFDKTKPTIEITGRVQSSGRGYLPFVSWFRCENSKYYYIYPNEFCWELSSLQGRLIKFTVIVLDDLQLEDGKIYVIPVSWEIIVE